MGRGLKSEATIGKVTASNDTIMVVDTASYNVMSYDKIDDYYSRGYLICSNVNGDDIFVISDVALLLSNQIQKNPHQKNSKALAKSKRSTIIKTQNNPCRVKVFSNQDFQSLVRQAFSRYNKSRALYHLDFLTKSSSSKNVKYKKVICILLLSMLCICFYAPYAFYFLNNMVYLLQNLLKTLLFISASSIKPKTKSSEKLQDYPIYTILLPIYKESGIALSLIKAIDQMTYPKSKLDVKIVVEEDDIVTLRAIPSMKLPAYMDLIKVPYSIPRTKPKALNYAMHYSRGKYVVVYDAEDRPEPDQLLKAIRLFSKLPTEYACLQAKLNFYNQDENLLTKLFSIEYSLWFDFLLKGLSLWGLPITLGGTSNHLKADVLKSIGCWDAYNVTEDADLGIRLYLHGFKTAILDSYTMEEAPLSLGNWMQQRARWIKGFAQTFIVYLKHHATTGSRMSKRAHATIFIFVGLSTYSFMMLPWLIIIATFVDSSFLKYMLIINTIFALSYMYGVALTILKRNKRSWRNFTKQDVAAFLLWPLYFALHTIASYRAIFELITQPFRWNKTKHGMSRYADDLLITSDPLRHSE
jgi:cellulose synthase/poly-beta-1,6-N-acetylglucosamine synthase-like glycosyltransferase